MNTRSDPRWGLLFCLKLAGGALFVLLAFLAGALLSNQPVSAQRGKEDGRRAFYLTQSLFDGSQASTACAVGFHMASIYEILDPSNLKYHTTLGVTTDDSGAGPPQGPPKGGWIRTGDGAFPETLPSETTPAPGNQDCANWTVNAGQGTTVRLGAGWDFHEAPRMHPWLPALLSCSEQLRVWCVQD